MFDAVIQTSLNKKGNVELVVRMEDKDKGFKEDLVIRRASITNEKIDKIFEGLKDRNSFTEKEIEPCREILKIVCKIPVDVLDTAFQNIIRSRIELPVFWTINNDGHVTSVPEETFFILKQKPNGKWYSKIHLHGVSDEESGYIMCQGLEVDPDDPDCVNIPDLGDFECVCCGKKISPEKNEVFIGNTGHPLCKTCKDKVDNSDD